METKKIPVTLLDGTIIQFEVSQSGRQNVSFKSLAFDDVAKAIEGISESIHQSIVKVRPQKATVKFGIEVSVEAGKLAAAVVKGSGKANLEITLEWNNPKN
ncbi:MAG: CU044_2847 family protein [Cyanobacteria bacterium J06560_6]